MRVLRGRWCGRWRWRWRWSVGRSAGWCVRSVKSNARKKNNEEKRKGVGRRRNCIAKHHNRCEWEFFLKVENNRKSERDRFRRKRCSQVFAVIRSGDSAQLGLLQFIVHAHARPSFRSLFSKPFPQNPRCVNPKFNSDSCVSCRYSFLPVQTCV